MTKARRSYSKIQLAARQRRIDAARDAKAPPVGANGEGIAPAGVLTTRRYRAPSELMHENGGWQETFAPSAQAALAYFRNEKGMDVQLNQLQVLLDRWRFADLHESGS